MRRLPFLPQDRYDLLLWACDVNFVRGAGYYARAFFPYNVRARRNVLIDASASMATGTPDKLLFAKRAAAALGDRRVESAELGDEVVVRLVARAGRGDLDRRVVDDPEDQVARRLLRLCLAGQPGRLRRRGITAARG